MDKIKLHYAEQANKWGNSKQSTMLDINIRDKEVEKIIQCIKYIKTHFGNTPKILEVGCGNGYTAEQIFKELNLELECIDFSEDLIEIAKKRKMEKITFNIGDVLDLEYSDDSFVIVFTEMCLINLDSWGKQKKALNEIRRVLKTGGTFVMIEAYTDGLNNLNEAREAVGLEVIPQPHHNLFFEKKKLSKCIKNIFKQSFEFENCENFLSSYYFGSKVLYPALIKNKRLEYNNKFVEFFKYLPAYGNYSYVQMLIFKKI